MCLKIYKCEEENEVMGEGGEIKIKKRGEWGLKDGWNECEGKKLILGIWVRECKICESDMSILWS